MTAIDWTATQKRLTAAGYVCGPADGIAGPKTWGALFRYAGNPHSPFVDAMAHAPAPIIAARIDQPLRLAHWLGQCSHEAMGFLELHERWGPTAEQARYEGRVDLGNTQPGDGKRFLGRGLIMITGRANYATAGKRLGIDLIAHPELAERPDIAIATACDFWAQHGLNALADADDVLGISRAINCGSPRSTRTPNGLASRMHATERARTIIVGV